MDKSQKVYKVLFKGVIFPGFDKTQVINNIQELTKIPADIISRKFFSGKTVVIRRADNETYAQQLKQSFTEAGIETTIEEVKVDSAEEGSEEEMLDDLKDSATQKSGITFKAIYIIPIVIAAILILSFSLFSTDEDAPPASQVKKMPEIATSRQEKSITTTQSTTTEIQDAAVKETSIQEPSSLQKQSDTEFVSETIPSRAPASDTSLLSEVKQSPDSDTGEEALPPQTDSSIEQTVAAVTDEVDELTDDNKIVQRDNSISTTETAATETIQPSVSPTEMQAKENLIARPVSEQPGDKFFAGYDYGNIPLNISTEKLRAILEEENPKFKDYSGNKNIKLLAPDDAIETIRISDDETLELIKIGDIYCVTKNQEIVSITLDSSFLFSDSPYIQGSYNLRVFPVMKQRFPLFLSKFIDNFSDADGSWWKKYIEPLKDSTEAQTIRIVGNKYTIIINYKPRVSIFSDFSLSDYASKPIYNDRLSVTLIRTPQ